MGYSAAVKEKIFAQTNRDKFQKLILRAAGDDNYPADFNISNAGSAHMRDAYFQTLCKDGGLKLDIRTGSKCVAYLNGAYWGVYDLREVPDDHDYTDYNYGQGKYDLQYIETWGNTWAAYGGSQALAAWSTLRSYIFANSMSVQANYDYAASQLDVESIADYMICNSLGVTSDWLNYNTGWWRGMNPNGTHKKWGYILWDNDAIFNFYINYTNIPSTSYTAPVCNIDNLYLQNGSDPEEHTKVLKRLRDNPGFNNWYINRYVDLLNTTFSCQNMLDFLDSTKAVIDPEMTRQCARWGGTYAGWLANFNTLRTFISNRCGATGPNGMQNCYNVTGPYPITFSVSPAGAGKIGVNSLTITQLPWAANYFGNIDVNITTTAYSITSQFVKWIPLNNPTILNDGIAANKIKFSKRDTVTATFILDVGIQKNSSPIADRASVYPNPASDAFFIEFDLSQRSNVSIKMFSMSGQKVGEFVPNESSFDIGSYKIDVNHSITSTLESGMYLVVISTGKYSQTFKLVIQK
jgi:hypothetical protein